MKEKIKKNIKLPVWADTPVRPNRGITLVALVITIIIMLILATVTIGAINGGLFNYAGKAVSEAELDSIIEELKTKGIMKGKNNLNGTLSEVLENNYSKYDSTFKVVNGELVYTGEDGKIVGYLLELGQSESSIEHKSAICSFRGHDFLPANYLNPKTCKRCGTTEGEILVATAPHPDQNNSTDIGIGTDGELVNLDKWTYTLSAWTYKLTGYAGDYTADGALEEGVTVPQKIKGVNVTSMNGTFKNNTNLKIAPEIPSTVWDMQSTFEGCTALVQAPIIPYGVTKAQYTFKGCTSIKTLPKNFILPDSITDGYGLFGTFAGCSSLEELPDNFRIPKNAGSIWSLFSGCTSLKKLPEGFTIPDSVTNLQSTFENCKSLTKLPDSFKLSANANNCGNLFKGCSNLESLPENFSFPSTTRSMSYAFEGCSKLTQLPMGFNIPNGVTNLQNTFMNCTSLSELPENFTIPTSATNLQSMFSRSTKIEGSITILGDPTNVAYIFAYSSASEGNGLKVYYTDACTKIDSIKSATSSNSKITYEEITIPIPTE